MPYHCLVALSKETPNITFSLLKKKNQTHIESADSFLNTVQMDLIVCGSLLIIYLANSEERYWRWKNLQDYSKKSSITAMM